MKKKYRTPKVVNMPEAIHSGALTGAAWMLARAAAKALKGHIDLKAGMDGARTLQARK